MRITDSRDHGGVGIIALQDHRGGLDIENRMQVMATRVEGRGRLGEFEYTPELVGDLMPGFVWDAFSRSMPAWGFVFGSTTVERQTRTTARPIPRRRRNFNDRPDPNNPPPAESDGVGGGNIAPSFFVPRAQPDSAGGGNGASGFIRFGSVAGITTLDTAEEDDDFLPVLPVRGTGWKADERFSYKTPPRPKMWPYLPSDWKGLTVADTEESRQELFFHPTDPRIPLVHRGDWKTGAVVCDIEPGQAKKPDENRHARLHTMLRIIVSPPRSKGANSVAWNLTDTGSGDGAGGFIVDRAEQGGGPTTPGGGSGRGPITPGGGSGSGGPVPGAVQSALRQIARDNAAATPGSVRSGLRTPSNASTPGGAATGSSGSVVVAASSHNFDGVLHPGLPNDRHRIGKDGDGNPVNPLHLNILGNFINPNRTREDGPLDLERVYLQGGNLDYELDVHFAWAPRKQRFGWWTTSAEESYPPPPPSDPGDPGPPPTTPPPETPNPPPDPGPPTPGGDGDGTFTPGDIGGPSLPPGHGYGGQDDLGGIPGFQNQKSESDAGTVAIEHTRRWLEQSTAAHSFRAQRWGDGEPNLVRSPGHEMRGHMDAQAPTVGRIEVFAKQPGSDFSHTMGPNASRYQGGTASGGMWVFPPEVTGEDYGSDFAPGNRPISSTVWGMGPGSEFGLGSPDLTTGGIRDGYGMKGSSGVLEVNRYDSAGSAQHVVSLDAAGAFEMTELTGDPSQPASGRWKLYFKAGGLYHMDDLGVVTGPLSA